jgi:predicted nucleic acid-binding protein
MKVVSNATPIISLATIDKLSLLSKLFGKIYVPKAVYQEIKAKEAFGYQEIDSDYFQIAEITENVGCVLRTIYHTHLHVKGAWDAPYARSTGLLCY